MEVFDKICQKLCNHYKNGNSHRICVLGQSNVGKTTFLKSLLINCEDMLFEEVNVVSQTAETEEQKKKFKNITTDKNVSTIPPSLENYKKLNKAECNILPLTSLQIFDDVDNNTYAKHEFGELVKQGRHYKISVIVLMHNILYMKDASVRNEFGIFYITAKRPQENEMKNIRLLLPHDAKLKLDQACEKFKFEENKRYVIYLPHSSSYDDPQIFECIELIGTPNIITNISRFVNAGCIDVETGETSDSCNEYELNNKNRHPRSRESNNRKKKRRKLQ